MGSSDQQTPCEHRPHGLAAFWCFCCCLQAASLSPSLALSQGLSDSGRHQLAWWLGGCSAWVFSMVVLGGFTRLTRSGLSMTDWKFTGACMEGHKLACFCCWRWHCCCTHSRCCCRPCVASLQLARCQYCS